MASNRQSTLSIDLGGEQILLQRVEAVEALGRPFTITVDLFSELAELDLLPHLGKPAVVKVNHDDDALVRHFHGIVTEGEFLSEQSEGFQYRLVLRPFTYFLSHNRDFRIFQEKTALDIIQQVLRDAGVQAFEVRAAGSATPRTYCVQYGESDFAFISRLMEEEGMYYHFAHTAEAHTLVLCDKPGDHRAGKAPTLTYNTASASVLHVDNSVRAAGSAKFYIQRWHERVVTGGEARVTIRDFDFEQPAAPIEQKIAAGRAHPRDEAEVYEWPGDFVEAAHGKRLAQALLDGRRAERRTFTGESQLPSLECGTTITLAEHPNDRYNRGVLITRTHHVLVSETYRSARGGDDQGVVFEAIPDDVAWRSPQVTPRPIVRGPETAIVTGPAGETIYTDKYGRVKVRFHWDRGATKPENATCWIRVSQTGGLGNIILPRVGHEVIVDFLDGDPDRPMVVGRVFNQENMPIYTLPDNKTRALWRSKTYTSGGGSDDVGAAKALDTKNPGANELRFEDKVGKEELFLHAQRDMNTRVRRNETHFVGLDQDEQIHGSRKVTIDEADELKVGKSITIDAGTTIEVTAKTSITFKVGQTTMKLDPMGVTVTTATLKMEGKMLAEMKSPMTTVKGDGMLTLKGGMTMIN